jgi:hypothetical protein
LDDSVPRTLSVGESLLAAGWRQGRLFRLEGVAFFWNEVAQVEGDTHVERRSRELKSNELVVVASQDCDILSSSEKYIEALLVRIKNKPRDRGYLASLLNSYREIVLDRELGLVADARVRLHIAKELLPKAEFDPWEMNDEVRADFVDWLAGRYDRPPVPDAVYEALSRPVRQVIERLRDEENETFLALDRSVRKIRIRLPPDGSAPLDLGLLFITRDALDDAGADAIEAAIEAIEIAVATNNPACNLKIETVPYGQLLLHEFDATRPIDLDYMTDQGDEVLLASSESHLLEAD